MLCFGGRVVTEKKGFFTRPWRRRRRPLPRPPGMPLSASRRRHRTFCPPHLLLQLRRRLRQPRSQQHPQFCYQSALSFPLLSQMQVCRLWFSSHSLFPKKIKKKKNYCDINRIIYSIKQFTIFNNSINYIILQLNQKNKEIFFIFFKDRHQSGTAGIRNRCFRYQASLSILYFNQRSSKC